MDDAVYMTKKEKYHAVVEAVKEAHAKGQPVLVGTITIDDFRAYQQYADAARASSIKY